MWSRASDLKIADAPELVIVHVLRGRANKAHVRQSGLDSGHGFQVKVLTAFQVVPSSLASHIHEDASPLVLLLLPYYSRPRVE